MNKEIVIIINPLCSGGKGWKKWLSVKNELYRRLKTVPREIVLEQGVHLQQELSLPTGDNEACLISAGGDGSINYLVNVLMRLDETVREKLTIGAIGLGSSNDFLKPVNQRIGAVPVLINIHGGTIRHDAGVTVYSDADGVSHQKYFVVNASFGVTAEANWRFNHPSSFLRFLKKNATGAAIVYSAVSTIISHQNRRYTLTLDEKESATIIANINVLKSPFVSGSFWYKKDITKDDGKVHFNACLNMSKWELLGVLNKLQKGIFKTTEKTVSAAVQKVQLTAATPFVFECDGETDKAQSVAITVLPHALNVLAS